MGFEYKKDKILGHCSKKRPSKAVRFLQGQTEVKASKVAWKRSRNGFYISCQRINRNFDLEYLHTHTADEEDHALVGSAVSEVHLRLHH